MKIMMIAGVLLLALSSSVLAETVDEAEAKKRGVTVDRIQLEKERSRVAELEKQLASVRAELAALKRSQQIQKPDSLSESQWEAAKAIVENLAASESELEAAEAKLRLLERGRIVPGWKGASTVDAAGEITYYNGQNTGQQIKDSIVGRQKKIVEGIANRIRDLKAGKIIAPDLIAGAFKSGTTGRLRFSDDVPAPDRYKVSAQISQIVDKQNLVVKIGQESVWISGLSTEGLVDGKWTELKGIFKVGTKTYGTAIGSQRTIFSLEFVPEDGIEAAVALIRLQQEKK